MRSLELRHIAWRNLRRRKMRTALLSAGLIVGVACVVAVLSATSAMTAEMNRRLDEFGANLIVQPDAADLALTYGGIAVTNVSATATELSQADVEAIRTIRHKENINLVAPKLIGLAEVEGARHVVVGARFPDEMVMRKWWRWSGEPPTGSDQVVIGSEVARKLGRDVGDQLQINGRSYRVAAVLETAGSAEDTAVYGDLGEMQVLLGKPGRISLIEVSAWCASCPIDTLALEISLKLPNARVSAVRQSIVAKEQFLSFLTQFALGLSVLVLLIGGVVMLMAMMASVSERVREIGVFRAVGFRQRHVMQLVLTEVLMISTASGVAGFVVGTLATKIIGRQLSDVSFDVGWDPLLGLGATLLALVVGGLGGVYPAWRAANLDPVAALRSL
ncbi:MAG: ABC transporter permease [Chloroflexota bacterium]|nr:MAG: ABC transporter permease [Chloroflexota bacterium]